MQQKPPVALYLDKRSKLVSGKHPLKVRVTFVNYIDNQKVWDQHYYPTGLSFTEADYKKITTSKTKGSNPDFKIIREWETKAIDIVRENPYITPSLFNSLFSGEYARTADLVKLYKERIDYFHSHDKISSRDSYKCAIESFKEFNRGLNLNNITEDWLRDYEQWMLKPRGVRVRKKEDGTDKIKLNNDKASSITTVGIYLITLRAVYNLAIKRRIIARERYPFGKDKYVIPTSNNPKKALNQVDKIKFLKYKPANEVEAFHHGMWKWSYYCNGMNFTDMAYLQENNINQELLVYVRRKTSATKRTQKPMVIPLRKEALEILARYGQNKPYLFNIIQTGDSAVVRKQKITEWIDSNNKTTKAIAVKLGIQVKVTTYTARHTVATTLLEAGADLRDIKETFGHDSFSTTERYIASLDLSRKKKLVDML